MRTQHDLHRLLYRIGQAYYMEGLNQQQIAARFGLSRPKVSRLLQQARDDKIVNITLVPPTGGLAHLEALLEQRFGLDEVVIVSVSDPKNARVVARELGPPAAGLFMRSVQGNKVVGIAWGATILGMVDALPSGACTGLTVVQMIGGLGPVGSDEHSAELVRRAARKLNAQFRLLSAPGIVSSQAALKALKSDPCISETLDLAANADIAVVGLGVLNADSILLRDGRILGENDLRLLERAGAVGDLVLRFMDSEGQMLELEMNKRIVGLSLGQVKRIPRVIGIAGGEQKFGIIHAALKSGILNGLVTDHVTAQRLAECIGGKSDRTMYRKKGIKQKWSSSES
jgi:DNA-binding transcriptional regulator LsrR (DeoR family)